MTQQEIQELTIFVGYREAFIGKKLKNGKLSKIKRKLTEHECMNFVTWFIRNYCDKYTVNEFVMNVDGVPKYKLGYIEPQFDKVITDKKE